MSAFVFADLMALLCLFCGVVIALWLCMHSFIFMEMQSLGVDMQSVVFLSAKVSLCQCVKSHSNCVFERLGFLVCTCVDERIYIC